MRQGVLRVTVPALLATALLGTSAAHAFPFRAPHLLPERTIPAVDASLYGQSARTAEAAPGSTAMDKTALPSVTVAGVKIAPATDDDTPTIVRAARRLSCVPFARALSGIDIRGNAKTWWTKAKGLYAKLTTPKAGAVMVFAGTKHLRLGHVAVVKEIVSAREVRVDHANWGNDGKIYLNSPVIDVSARNDWSEVRVWNTRLGVLGSHTYRLSGFIAD